jgi:hypothetical protein
MVGQGQNLRLYASGRGHKGRAVMERAASLVQLSRNFLLGVLAHQTSLLSARAGSAPKEDESCHSELDSLIEIRLQFLGGLLPLSRFQAVEIDLVPQNNRMNAKVDLAVGLLNEFCDLLSGRSIILGDHVKSGHT